MAVSRQKLTADTWEWTPQRERAALAVAESKTLVDAAETAGVTRQTLYDWLRIAPFHDRVNGYTQEFIQRARWRLQRKADDAAQKVIDVMEFGNAQHATRLAAAKDILDRVGLKAPEKIEHGGTIGTYIVDLGTADDSSSTT